MPLPDDSSAAEVVEDMEKALKLEDETELAYQAAQQAVEECEQRLADAEKAVVDAEAALEASTDADPTELEDKVFAVLKVQDISQERVEDARTVFNIGDKISARIVSIDKKARQIQISVKALLVAEEKEAVRSLNENIQEKDDDLGPTTIGQLIKEQMEGRR